MTQHASECTEGQRHAARQKARADVEEFVFDYASAHGIGYLDILGVLAEVSVTALRYADRDDEERRTGFRHRLPGE